MGTRLATWLSFLCILGVLAGLFGFSLRAAEKPSADYVEAMRTLATVATELPKSLASDDVKAMDELVIKVRPAIGVVRNYWADRKVEDALQSIEAAAKAIAEISVAVHLMGTSQSPLAKEGAQESITNFLASCATCHHAHRESLPDGTYAIK